MEPLEEIVADENQGRRHAKECFYGEIYKIKTTRDRIVALVSLDGTSRVLTKKNNLDLFYEKVENFESPSDCE